MHGAEAVRRIHREIQEWRGDGPEVSWTKQGLARAKAIVLGLAAEERARNQAIRPKLHRWLAGDLFRAVRQALHYLKRGDRARGIEVLEEAVRAVTEAEKKGIKGLAQSKI